MDARRVVALGLMMGCAAGTDGMDEVAPTPFRVDRLELHTQGAPYLVTGELGRISAPQLATLDAMRAALDEALPPIADQLRVPAADLVLQLAERDSIGITHVRYDQVKNGLPVVGGRVYVHVGADGAIQLVTSSARDAAVDSRATVAADAAATIARGSDGSYDAAAPRLAYEISSRDGELRLTWEVVVSGRESILNDAKVYVDAHTGAIVDRHPLTFPVRTRRVYDGNNAIYPTTSVTQIGSEGSPGANASGIAAYNNTGTTYDFYKTQFNRDSYDNAGHSLDSVVRVRFPGGSGNNAVWYSPFAQMAYGEGDGTTFGPLALALDVTAHELTHAVTSATADLVYADESGALNEAMSDIMGSTCEAWKDGAVSNDTWLIGEDIFTPNKAGDALRYMSNPTADAPLYPGTQFVSSRDYYPERFVVVQPDDTNDFGGVHFNSGIANLAYYLLVQGGHHPRNKTAHNVPAIGLEKAGKIFEYALTMGLFQGNTGFSEARTATETAAMMLYGAAEKSAVSLTWAAVGVGALPPPDTVPPTIDITNPTAESQVLPEFQIDVTATDNVGVLKLELTIDGMMVATANASTLTFKAPATLMPGMHHIQATAYDAFNQSTKAANVQLAQVCVMDPECPMDQHCESGICMPGAPKTDEGGCCDTGGGSPAGALALGFGTLLVLRRRRR